MENEIMKKLISKCLEKNVDFDFVNNVLTFEDNEGEKYAFWLWFGKVLIPHDSINGEKVTAKDMVELEKAENVPFLFN